MWLFVGPHENIEKTKRKLMRLRFCGTRSRETRGESILELFPTLPTYQNPINIDPGPLLCKVSWFFGFSLFAKFFQFSAPIGPVSGPIGSRLLAVASRHPFWAYQGPGSEVSACGFALWSCSPRLVLEIHELREWDRHRHPPQCCPWCVAKNGSTNWKNIAKSEKTKNQETLHKSGPGLIKMGFW